MVGREERSLPLPGCGGQKQEKKVGGREESGSKRGNGRRDFIPEQRGKSWAAGQKNQTIGRAISR